MARRKEKFINKLKNGIFTMFLVVVMLFWVQGFTNASGLRFVQISDTHYMQDAPNTTFKMIAESPKLLDDVIEQVNETPNVDFVMFTGDLIDKPFEKELTSVLGHLKNLHAPWYFAFGNHDVCVGGYLTKKLYFKILRENNPNFTAEKPYYSFSPKKGYKVIVLDSTIDSEITSQGNIYDEELTWLDEELSASEKDIVLIFMHAPLNEPFSSPNHKIRNAAQVIATIEKYKNPIAVFTGHYHAARIFQNGNVLYVCSPAVVSYPNAFRVINITEKRGKVIFDIKMKPTRLENVQKLAKLMVFASNIYAGEEKDQNAVYEIKR